MDQPPQGSYGCRGGAEAVSSVSQGRVERFRARLGRFSIFVVVPEQSRADEGSQEGKSCEGCSLRDLHSPRASRRENEPGPSFR